MSTTEHEPEQPEQQPEEIRPEATQPTAEPRAERLRRQGRHTRLYVWAFALVALIVIVVALAVANTRQVKVSWVVGTSKASLVWIVVVAAVLGWLLGMTTSVVFRLRTRRHQPRR